MVIPTDKLIILGYYVDAYEYSHIQTHNNTPTPTTTHVVTSN